MTRWEEPPTMPSEVATALNRWVKDRIPPQNRGEELFLEVNGPVAYLTWRVPTANWRWNSLGSCYGFNWLGMYVGVEMNGYIHT